MSNSTFLYGRYSVRDVQWLVKTVTDLKTNAWDPDCPVLFCGSVWQQCLRERAVMCLLGALRVNTSALSVVIRNADIDLKAQKALCEVFAENTHLKTFSLMNVRYGLHPLVVPLELFRNKNLSQILLEGCTISATGCFALAKMLRSSQSLNSLTLIKVTIQGGLGPFANALKTSPFLRLLKLDSMSLSFGDTQILFSGLEKNASLTKLQLVNLNLDHQCSNSLANIIACNLSLEELSLSKNNLRGDAIEIIVHGGLMHSGTLRKLDLSHNPIGDDGALHLVQALQRVTSLQELRLVDCDIWKSGIIAFVQLLPSFHSLTRISLDGNDVEDCVDDLVKALESNVFLVHVLDSLPRLLNVEKKRSEYGGPWRLVDWYLRLNKAKRRFLVEKDFSPSLLPVVIHKSTADSSVLFHFLRTSPCLCSSSYSLKESPVGSLDGK